MATILQGGTVIELEPATVEQVDLRVEGGKITRRGRTLPVDGAEVVALEGKLVMPGLVCAHQHLYSALARGMPRPPTRPESFLEILEKIWWRLDTALDLDTVQTSATVGALEALVSGTTSLFDHHASPKAIKGSLTRVARGVNEVGLRGVLCYEVTDRHGAVGREEGLEETVEFQRKAKGRFRGMVGAHASFTLSADALIGLKEAAQTTGTGVHLHLAEDLADDRLSRERYGESAFARLNDAGLLTPRSLVAHAVHLGWPELASLLGTGAWLVHNPRSNMNNQVGYAPVGKFGARASLGTDGLGSDMFAEAQLAHFRALDAGAPIDVLRYLANGHRLVSEQFETPIGPMREGAAADLLILDYRPPTPLDAGNLPGHFLYGMASRQVEAVMIDGVWRMWARRPLSVNPEAISAQAQAAAVGLWSKLAER